MSKPKRYRVTLDLGPVISGHIDELLATGLYGFTRTQVVDEVFRLGLRDVLIRRGVLVLPKRR